MVLNRGRGKPAAPAKAETEAVKRRTRRTRRADGVLGEIDPNLLPAELRSLVTRLAEEVDRLAGKLDRSRRRIEELEILADEDPLARVLNRRGFLREMKRAIAFGARYRTPAALVFLDLDDFKSINDRYGHATGDDLLAAVGALLQREVRASDVVGRLGGDEFAIILWNARPADAERKAAALSKAIRECVVRHGADEVAVGASAGTAELLPDDTPAAALQRADAAMYAAKASRRSSLKA